MNTLAETIERGRRAITLAKAQGLDTTTWEKRLAELERQVKSAHPPKNPLAEAQEIARRVREHGICLVWAEAVKDFLAFIRDESMIAQVPPGFVIYTDAELKELLAKGGFRSPATLRLIHEAKKQGFKVANG